MIQIYLTKTNKFWGKWTLLSQIRKKLKITSETKGNNNKNTEIGNTKCTEII